MSRKWIFWSNARATIFYSAAWARASHMWGRACVQVSKQVLQLRSQQALLRTAFEGELQRAAADCANGVEAMQARWRQVCADSPV